MSKRHSDLPPTDPEDNKSSSETEPSSGEESTSSNSEEVTGCKEKVETDAKTSVKPKKPAVTSSQSRSSTSSPVVIVSGIATMIPVAQKYANEPSAAGKSTDSPKRCRSERHFEVFREIRRMSKERMRLKQMRRILKNFLVNYPLASMMASQTIRSPTTSRTSPIASRSTFPDIDSLKRDKLVAPSTSAAKLIAGPVADPGSKPKPEPTGDQFVIDRVNNLTEVLDEIEGLEDFIAQRKMFDTDEPGPSSRFPTHQGESIMHRLAATVLDSLMSLRKLAEGLRSWCLSQNATVEELKYYMNLLSNTNFSSPDSMMVRQMLRSWENNSGSVSQLGDATCLLQVENRLYALQQSLIAESHVMHFKYWADRTSRR